MFAINVYLFHPIPVQTDKNYKLIIWRRKSIKSTAFSYAANQFSFSVWFL